MQGDGPRPGHASVSHSGLSVEVLTSLLGSRFIADGIGEGESLVRQGEPQASVSPNPKGERTPREGKGRGQGGGLEAKEHQTASRPPGAGGRHGAEAPSAPPEGSNPADTWTLGFHLQS